MGKNQLNKYLKFVNVAFQMGIVIAAGVFFGIWMDKKFPNEYSGFTIFFSLFGVFAALYQVIKSVINLNGKE